MNAHVGLRRPWSASPWQPVPALLALSLLAAACGQTTAPQPAPTTTTTGASQPATTAPLTKLTVVHGNVSDGMIPFWQALDTGVFAKHGLDVTFEFVLGIAATQAMVSGQYDVGLVSTPAVISSNVQGADLRLLLALLSKNLYALVVSKDISSPEQLRGKTLGISRFGDASDNTTRLIMRGMGLNPEQDVSIMQVGNSPERYTALVAGHIQGMIASPMDAVRARRDGFIVLADQAALNFDYASNAVAARTPFVREQRDTARRFVMAVVESTHRYKTRQEEAAIIGGKYLQSDDLEALREAVRVYGTYLMPNKPYITEANLRPIIDEVASTLPAVREVPWDRYVDQSLLEEVDRGGFIDALYR
jgi:NitT/TauT family transport system substrate-binding protein